MRAVIFGLTGVLLAGTANAADYLRGSSYEGPPAAYDWSGFYFGGQVAYSNSDFGMSKAVKGLVADILRDTTIEKEANVSTWPSLANQTSRDASYGGYVGYNSQWGEAVLGLEANYLHLNGKLVTSSDSIGRSHTTTDSYLYNVHVSSNASARLTDFGTVRARAGWAIGWLMPFATAGVAIGRVQASRSANVSLTYSDVSTAALDQTDGIDPRPGGSLNQSKTEAKNNAIAFGYALGLGVDVGLFPGVFLRGEWEMVQLGNVLGMNIRTNTVRASAAVKF